MAAARCCARDTAPAGALAGVATVWAGHSWPDADVRCMTFGAPM